jgi:STAS domain
MVAGVMAERGDMQVVALRGEVTLQTIGAAHDDLLLAARSTSQLLIRLEPDAAFDLAGVQLLESARRWVDANGGAVALAEAPGSALLQTLDRGGFLQTLEQRRFWLNEDRGL